jgi:hypothetical protein
MYYIKKKLLLALLVPCISCRAQDISADDWARVDKILFPDHTPVISSEKLRYVPQETQMEFYHEVILRTFNSVIAHRRLTNETLSAVFEKNESEFTTFANQINAATVKKKKFASLPPSPSWCSYIPIFSWLCDCCTQWNTSRSEQQQLREQANAFIEKQLGYTHAYAQNQDVLHDLKKTEKKLKNCPDKHSTVSLSGREFACCAQMCLHDRGTPLRDQSYWFMNEKVRNCFTVLHTYNAYYNPRGRKRDEDLGPTAKFPMYASYRPFQIFGNMHETFSEEALFLLPYVKQTAVYAGAYDGYGYQKGHEQKKETLYDCCMHDPRYDIDIHGPFGAIFMKSPHESDYDNTAKGEEKTWVRRNSRDEFLSVTADEYINRQNSTKGVKHYSRVPTE